jgi:hypothetical protein
MSIIFIWFDLIRYQFDLLNSTTLQSKKLEADLNSFKFNLRTEPPPTKVEGFSGLERLRRTVGSFPTEVGGFKPDFWKMKI